MTTVRIASVIMTGERTPMLPRRHGASSGDYVREQPASKRPSAGGGGIRGEGERTLNAMGNCPSSLRLLDRIDLVCGDDQSSSIASNAAKDLELRDTLDASAMRKENTGHEIVGGVLGENEETDRETVLYHGHCMEQFKKSLLQETSSSFVDQETLSVETFYRTAESQSPRLATLSSPLSNRASHLATAALPKGSNTLPSRCQAKQQRSSQTSTPRLAVHKHTSINTSTGSSTSGVEISSSSSRSDLPYCPGRKYVQIIELSCDAGDLSSPEDCDNPLYVYRTPSFKKAIERGSTPDMEELQNLSWNKNRDFLEPLPYISVQHNPSYVPPKFSPKSRKSSKGPHLIPPPYPFNSSLDASATYSKYSGSSGVENSSRLPKQQQEQISQISRPTVDAAVEVETEIRKEHSFETSSQTNVIPEQGASPNICRYLSTLKEEDFSSEASNAGLQNNAKHSISEHHNRQVNSLYLNRDGLANGPLTFDGSDASFDRHVHMSCNESLHGKTNKDEEHFVSAKIQSVSPVNDELLRQSQRKDLVTDSPSALIPVQTHKSRNDQSSFECLSSKICSQSSEVNKEEALKNKSEIPKAANTTDKVSLLGKSRRKSLQEMRHIFNNNNNTGMLDDEASEIHKSPDEDRSTFGSELYLTADPSDDSLSDGTLSPKELTFPSLSDSLLAQLGLGAHDPIKGGPEEISLQETEEKFSSLVLAFKTDRETLDKRKELHLRARDIAEQNIQKELEGLKDGMKTLNQICNNSSSQQTFAKVQHHLEVLEQSVARMSSQAEVHGAVQQELRVSRAIDVMVHHVENLKKVYEREHAELLEARKTLRSGRQDSRESGGNDASRSTNLPGLPQFRDQDGSASVAKQPFSRVLRRIRKSSQGQHSGHFKESFATQE